METLTIGADIRAGKYGGWNFSTEEEFRFSNLGTNVFHLDRVVQKLGENNTFVDLGVDYGVSSLILTMDAVEKNNKIYGVDTQFNRTTFGLWEYPNYFMIQGDSSSVGKCWDTEEYGEVDLLFVDSIHVAPQVLSELYHWYPHVKEGGYIVFHDTNWPAGMHDLTWHPEVKENDLKWARPEEAVGRFFQIEDAFKQADGKKAFTFEDDNIRVEHHPESWGLTVVQIKQKVDFINNITDWDQVFEDRNTVCGYFKNPADTFILNDIREEVE